MKIRHAEPEDMGQLLWLAREMHRESTYSVLPFEHQHCALNLARFVGNDQHLCLVVEGAGRCAGIEVVGAMLAQLSPAFFGPSLVAIDYALYVRPEHRGQGRIALKLVATYIDWAVAKGAKRVSLAGSAHPDSDKSLVKLAERLGMTRAGSVMYLEV